MGKTPVMLINGGAGVQGLAAAMRSLQESSSKLVANWASKISETAIPVPPDWDAILQQSTRPSRVDPLIVEMAQRLSALGKSHREIAEWLNSHGCLPKRGRWQKQSVQRMLKGQKT